MKMNNLEFMKPLRDLAGVSDHEEFQKAFDNAAKSLMRDHVLCVNDNEYHIAEIEFYYHSENHPDPYVHRNNRQKRWARWYLHRKGKGANDTIMSAPRSGLDITFGRKCTYGGILIRSLYCAKDKRLISGTCRVVYEILGDGEKSCRGKGKGVILGGMEKEPLHQIIPSEARKETLIFRTVRVGLNRMNDPCREFVSKPYAYIASPALPAEKDCYANHCL